MTLIDKAEALAKCKAIAEEAKQYGMPQMAMGAFACAEAIAALAPTDAAHVNEAPKSEHVAGDVLTALPDDVAGVVEEAGKVLEGVTPGPWWTEPEGTIRNYSDGTPRWDLPRFVRYDETGHTVCKTHLIGGVDPDPALANARFIAWCREGVPALIALATAQAAQIAGMGKERDELATANHRQASCIHVTAANLGPDCSATVDGLPKAARHVAAERDALLGAVKGLVEVLDQHETKGPLPDTALMFCWLAAQNVRAVLRGYMLEKPE